MVISTRIVPAPLCGSHPSAEDSTDLVRPISNPSACLWGRNESGVYSAARPWLSLTFFCSQGVMNNGEVVRMHKEVRMQRRRFMGLACLTIVGLVTLMAAQPEKAYI